MNSLDTPGNGEHPVVTRSPDRRQQELVGSPLRIRSKRSYAASEPHGPFSKRPQSSTELLALCESRNAILGLVVGYLKVRASEVAC
jgi:hypothetical protein